MKPVSGTNEWSTSTVNIQSGCSNNCIYCYARTMAIRFGRRTPESWKTEEIDQGKVAKPYGLRRGQVMFPSSHDITPHNWEACAKVLLKLLKAGNRVLVVSKPRPVVIEALCRKLIGWGLQVLFRFTIGAARSDLLGFWEPGAPSYEERLYSLMWCFRHGWRTSVSMEPLLERDWYAVQRQVVAMAPYVSDAIWIGKANHLASRCRVNLGEVPAAWMSEIEALTRSQSDERIRELYLTLKDHPKVRWKESIKQVVGLELATEKGLDR